MSIESIFKILPNKLSDNKVITPYNIAEKMVDDVLSNIDLELKTTFLDPVCKSGIFLKILYDKLMNHPLLVKSFKKPEDRSEHILENMLYGIALDELSVMIAKRTLHGQLVKNKNIVYIKDYERNVKEKKYKEVRDLIEKEFGKDMKIGVIIGNPPNNDNESRGGSIVEMLFTRIS